MQRCGYCGSSLLQREYEGDITCLACSRTLTLVPMGLPHVKAAELRVGSGPRVQAHPRTPVAEARRTA